VRAVTHVSLPALAVGLGVVLVVAGCAAPRIEAPAREPSATATAAPVASPSASPAAEAATPAERGWAPARITIPDIDVRSNVQSVGTVDRVLQIPPKPWEVGWWEAGVGQGSDHGTTVLVAHLDSRTYGVGPFARAKDLRVGAPMTLRDAQGQAQRYRVSAVDTYLKQVLPYEEIFAQTGPPRVVLVTCGGQYNRDAGGWDSNVVVTFTPEETPL
jgi:sortase (surface protein transpeptidase)